MFGIGKKKVTEKIETKEAEQEASDEIQFDFEEKDKLPFDDEEDFADEDFVEEPARKGVRQALSSRTLLLALLLLLVLGGGGYYFLNAPVSPPSPSKPVAPVKAKVKVQPVTPAPATAVKPSPAPVAVAPVKGAQSAPKAAATPAAGVNPAAPASVAKKVAAPAATEPTVAATPAAVVKPASPAPVDQKVVAAAPAAKNPVVTSDARPATRQPFTLSAGSFVSQKNLRAVEKKIRSLGYTPKVQTTYSMVPMTRLLLGVYDDPIAAQARSRELSKLVPDLFSLKQGDSVALYAGSYQDVDQARRYADQLYQLGILADEETVTLRMPVKNVSYGSFASRAAAEKAAKRAGSAGLTAQVVKR